MLKILPVPWAYPSLRRYFEFKCANIEIVECVSGEKNIWDNCIKISKKWKGLEIWVKLSKLSWVVLQTKDSAELIQDPKGAIWKFIILQKESKLHSSNPLCNIRVGLLEWSKPAIPGKKVANKLLSQNYGREQRKLSSFLEGL